MAASSGAIGYGTSLKYGTVTNSTAMTSVGEVIDVVPPDYMTGEDVEFTHYLSDGGYKEYKPGMKELGEAQFQMNFVAAQYNTVVGLLNTSRFWMITTADLTNAGSTDVFSGYVKRISKAIPVKDRITATVTIKATGVNTFTAGS